VIDDDGPFCDCCCASLDNAEEDLWTAVDVVVVVVVVVVFTTEGKLSFDDMNDEVVVSGTFIRRTGWWLTTALVLLSLVSSATFSNDEAGIGETERARVIIVTPETDVCLESSIRDEREACTDIISPRKTD
jgi:hypothetical protein